MTDTRKLEKEKEKKEGYKELFVGLYKIYDIILFFINQIYKKICYFIYFVSSQVSSAESLRKGFRTLEELLLLLLLQSSSLK